MHLVDGGVTRNLVLLIFGLKKQADNEEHASSAGAAKRKKHTKIQTLNIGFAHEIIEAWKKCTPCDFERRVRGLKFSPKWKMVEGRVFLFYLALPLLHVMDSHGYEAEMLKHLLLGIRVISGASNAPVQKVIFIS